MIGKAIALYALWQAWKERRAWDGPGTFLLLSTGRIKRVPTPRPVAIAEGRFARYVLRNDGSVLPIPLSWPTPDELAEDATLPRPLRVFNR